MEVLHIYIYCTTLFTIKIYNLIRYHLIRSTTIYTNSRLHCKSSKSLSHYFRSVTRATIFSFLHCTRKKNILVWIYLVLPGHNQYTDTHITKQHTFLINMKPYLTVSRTHTTQYTTSRQNTEGIPLYSPSQTEERNGFQETPFCLATSHPLEA